VIRLALFLIASSATVASAEPVLQKMTPATKAFIDAQALKFAKQACVSSEHYGIEKQVTTQDEFDVSYDAFLEQVASAKKMTGSTSGMTYGRENKTAYWFSARMFGNGVFTYAKFSSKQLHVYACRTK